MKKIITASGLSIIGIFTFLIVGGGQFPADSPSFPEISVSSDTSFGSGNFGAWEKDEFGAPVYRYTCNQLTDPIAVTRVNPDWISPTNHMHQIGNDRLVGVVSNYGYVQVRQDEGSPKFLNDFMVIKIRIPE